jgi:hypothetical protein
MYFFLLWASFCPINFHSAREFMLTLKKMIMPYLGFSLLYASFAYGQATLPPNVFTMGSQQTPLAVDAATQKQGTYGYVVASRIPQENADTPANNNSSTLRLFELWPDGSAKELGPAHSMHSEIRAFGGGRFSHWHETTNNSYYIFFSASDATDPRSNGRRYLAVQPGTDATGDTIGSIYNSRTNTRKYYLGTSEPQHRTVVISNPSNYAYSFGIAFNKNGFLQSSADLKAEIENGIPDFTGEPIERKIWRFVRDNRIHQVPYTEELWYHHPLLMFNSAGWGFCDDAAAALMHTAALFGVSARVWGLDGHVVPEVYTNGSWHLYDPDYETYFIDSTTTSNVASVSELVSNRSLITAPLLSAPWTSVTSTLAESRRTDYANLYSPDDAPEPWYNSLPVAEAPLTFDLPPGGAVEIGAHKSSNAPTTFEGGYQTTYSSVKILLPQDSVGKLQVFLIPYMIKGSGTVTLYFQDGSKETIPISSSTKWNINNTDYRNDYIKGLTYNAGKGGMVIYYLANPIRSSVRGFNSIVLKPSSTMPAGVANPLSVRLLRSNGVQDSPTSRDIVRVNR